MDFTVAFLIGMIIFFTPLAIIEMRRAKRRREYEEKTNALKNAMTMIKETMILRERNANLKEIIGIMPATRSTVNYSPEKLHIGAVTVGGVTTGGVYKTGGYSAGKTVTVNGRYVLMHHGEVIEKIRLTSTLKEIAQKSSIKEYLDKDGNIVVNEPVEFSEYARIALKLHNNPEPINAERAMGCPTMEKAQAILDWITCERE